MINTLTLGDIDRINRLLGLLERAKPIVEQDAQMMADISRFAPLPPENQAAHDSKEYPSEVWLRDYADLVRDIKNESERK